MKKIHMNLSNCTVECTTRAHQRQMIWNCIIGFFKDLPVTVYEGHLFAYGECSDDELQIEEA